MFLGNAGTQTQPYSEALCALVEGLAEKPPSPCQPVLSHGHLKSSQCARTDILEQALGNNCWKNNRCLVHFNGLLTRKPSGLERPQQRLSGLQPDGFRELLPVTCDAVTAAFTLRTTALSTSDNTERGGSGGRVCGSPLPCHGSPPRPPRRLKRHSNALLPSSAAHSGDPSRHPLRMCSPSRAPAGWPRPPAGLYPRHGGRRRHCDWFGPSNRAPPPPPLLPQRPLPLPGAGRAREDPDYRRGTCGPPAPRPVHCAGAPQGGRGRGRSKEEKGGEQKLL